MGYEFVFIDFAVLGMLEAVQKLLAGGVLAHFWNCEKSISLEICSGDFSIAGLLPVDIFLAYGVGYRLILCF